MYPLIHTIEQLKQRFRYKRPVCISVGVLAILMPFYLIIGNGIVDSSSALLPSISHYYYSKVGPWFVSSLILFSVFLCTSKSVCRKEKNWSVLGGICGFGTVMLPTMPAGDQLNLVYILHLVFALSLFIIVSILAIRYYASNACPIAKKYYQIAGYGILICLVILISFFFIVTLYGGHTTEYNTVLYIEVIMLVLLGSVWLAKGSYSSKRKS